jgi:hypothetical protein
MFPGIYLRRDICVAKQKEKSAAIYKICAEYCNILPGERKKTADVRCSVSMYVT